MAIKYLMKGYGGFHFIKLSILISIVISPFAILRKHKHIANTALRRQSIIYFIAQPELVIKQIAVW